MRSGSLREIGRDGPGLPLLDALFSRLNDVRYFDRTTKPCDRQHTVWASLDLTRRSRAATREPREPRAAPRAVTWGGHRGGHWAGARRPRLPAGEVGLPRPRRPGGAGLPAAHALR